MATDVSRRPEGEGRGARARDRIAEAEVSGWAGGTMLVLRWITLLVELNLMVVLGCLAGGVLLGVGPALRAGGVVASRMTGEAEPWRTFWRTWRAEFARTNLLFAPVWAILVLLWFDGVAVRLLGGGVQIALQAGLVLVALWCVVLLAYWPRVAARYDRPVGETWRFLAVAPLVAPGTALGVLVVVAATALAVWALPLVAALCGASFPLWATARLVDERLDRIDAQAL